MSGLTQPTARGGDVRGVSAVLVVAVPFSFWGATAVCTAVHSAPSAQSPAPTCTAHPTGSWLRSGRAVSRKILPQRDAWGCPSITHPSKYLHQEGRWWGEADSLRRRRGSRTISASFRLAKTANI